MSLFTKHLQIFGPEARVGMIQDSSDSYELISLKLQIVKGWDNTRIILEK